MPMSKFADPKPAEHAPILITMGDPSGVGPEVAVAAFDKLGGKSGDRPLKLVGSADVFRACGSIPGDALVDTGLSAKRTPGRTDPKNAKAVSGAIEYAVGEAMAGRAASIVTAPINKAMMLAGGFQFPGHTEYLEHLTNAPRAVMMLAGAGLRVVPYTIHIPLKDVPPLLTVDGIVETGTIIIEALRRDFGIAAPRLAVAGLNPHAGEDGEIGTEEQSIIRPAVEALEARGANVIGPLPADTMFHAEARAKYDAALCMYHDQALIPLKTLAFWDGVNVTLGLPIIRTSPDHGTALDIAGQGKADARSMIAAIELAAQMANARFR